MVSVEIRSIAPGACTWCGKEKEDVVTFALGDKSFAGCMCWNDLKRVLKMKVPQSTKAAPVPSEVATLK